MGIQGLKKSRDASVDPIGGRRFGLRPGATGPDEARFSRQTSYLAIIVLKHGAIARNWHRYVRSALLIPGPDSLARF